jgi:hypothetical protein
MTLAPTALIDDLRRHLVGDVADDLGKLGDVVDDLQLHRERIRALLHREAVDLRRQHHLAALVVDADRQRRNLADDAQVLGDVERDAGVDLGAVDRVDVDVDALKRRLGAGRSRLERQIDLHAAEEALHPAALVAALAKDAQIDRLAREQVLERGAGVRRVGAGTVVVKLK